MAKKALNNLGDNSGSGVGIASLAKKALGNMNQASLAQQQTRDYAPNTGAVSWEASSAPVYNYLRGQPLDNYNRNVQNLARSAYGFDQEDAAERMAKLRLEASTANSDEIKSDLNRRFQQRMIG